jgi:VanZ family protein
MSKIKAFLYRWGPFILVLVLIFIFSSIPKRELPDYHQWDFTVKKSGHVLGYFLLALACWHGLGWEKNRWWLAWVIAVLYSFIDEYHQSFIPGRSPALTDVAIDCFAAGLGLAAGYIFMKYLAKKT